ncbi:nucleoside triphosphate pyrophosphohydrolase [Polluticoccus soli]|uniref:nucleoside triphosphate pyrophosphohydrolase n=1 Tax=Polluticoccus soli TaxID=3034150 RepID=UPI0023E0BBA3|nr:nucleoside triphosphate pyrophosphohydrolase [Flavipsychrobacter sp. JY13-12]
MEYAKSIERLRTIMDELRERCPWDKKQTIQTLRPQTVEEVYELGDAIVSENWQQLKEELGDLLLHIVFYSKIGAEKNEFTFDDVIEAVCNKLVSRHPHIYGSVQVESEEQVKQNWEMLKLKEGKKSILSGVPPSMPAMIKALRLQEKTKQVGFEWDHIDQVKEKVDEEIKELYEAVDSGSQQKIEDEFGDVMFALINYARFAKVDPELALEGTNKKFIRRFQYIEDLAREQGKSLNNMTLEEMDALWNQAKGTE